MSNTTAELLINYVCNATEIKHAEVPGRQELYAVHGASPKGVLKFNKISVHGATLHDVAFNEKPIYLQAEDYNQLHNTIKNINFMLKLEKALVAY